VSPWRRERALELHIGAATRTTLPQRVDALVAQFEHRLDALAARPGSAIVCVVGGDALRYAVLPWHAQLSGAASRQLVAEQVFRETYGEAARAWSVVCEPAGRYGASALACAIDRVLLDRLEAVLRPRRQVLASVQPSLMHAFNPVRRSIVADRFWFVLDEPQGLTLLLMTAAGPQHVMQPPAGAALGPLLDREWFALGLDGERAPVYRVAAGAEHVRRACGDAAGWHVTDLAPRAMAPAPSLQAA
jgi:hypothetical protein